MENRELNGLIKGIRHGENGVRGIDMFLGNFSTYLGHMEDGEYILSESAYYANKKKLNFLNALGKLIPNFLIHFLEKRRPLVTDYEINTHGAAGFITPHGMMIINRRSTYIFFNVFEKIAKSRGLPTELTRIKG